MRIPDFWPPPPYEWTYCSLTIESFVLLLYSKNNVIVWEQMPLFRTKDPIIRRSHVRYLAQNSGFYTTHHEHDMLVKCKRLMESSYVIRAYKFKKCILRALKNMLVTCASSYLTRKSQWLLYMSNRHRMCLPYVLSKL